MLIVHKFKLFIFFCVNIFALLQNAQSQIAQISLIPTGSIRVNEGEPLVIECCVNGSIPGLKAIFYKNHMHVGHQRDTSATVHIQQTTLHDCGKYLCYAFTENDGVRKSYGAEAVEVEIIPNRRRSFSCGEFIEVTCDYGSRMLVNPREIVWKKLSHYSAHYSVGEKLQIPNCRLDDSGEYGCFYDNRPLYKTRITVIPSTEIGIATGITTIASDPNDSVHITCKVKGGEHIEQSQLSWRKDNRYVDSFRCFSTGNQLYLTNVVPEDSGVYSCYCQGRILYQTQLIVKPYFVRVEIDSYAEAIQYGPSGSTYRKCSVTTNTKDSTRLRVEWYDNKHQVITSASPKPYRITKSIVGSNPVMVETTLEITDAEPKHAGYYECRAVIGSCVDKQSFQFSVNDYTIGLKIDRHNVYVNEYTNEAVTCTGWTTNSLGSAKLTVQWYDPNQQLINNRPSPFSVTEQQTYSDKIARLEIRNPSMQNEGYYTCVATDGVKTVRETFCLFFVSAQPPPPLSKAHQVVIRTELTPYCLKLKENELLEINCEINSDFKLKIDLYHQPDYNNPSQKTRVGTKSSNGVFYSVQHAKPSHSGIYECYGHNSKEVISYNRITVEVERALVVVAPPPIISTCLSYERECKVGGCYPAWFYCDGRRDCNDGIDEACVGLLAKDNSCKPYEYKCKNQQKCIPKRQLCDGVSQCSGGDDEKCTTPVVNYVKADKYTVYEGETVEISCQSSGFPVPFVYWELNGADVCRKPRCVLSSSNGQGTLKIQNATVLDSGLYECVARNAKDKIKSTQPIKLEVISREQKTENVEIILEDDKPSVILDLTSEAVQNGPTGTVLRKCTVITNSSDPTQLSVDWYDNDGQAILDSVPPFKVIKRTLGDKPVIAEVILNITNAEQTFSGNYECRAALGSRVDKQSFTFKVLPSKNVENKEEALDEKEGGTNIETEKTEANIETKESETKIEEPTQKQDEIQESLTTEPNQTESIKTGDDIPQSETTQKEDSIEIEQTTKSEDDLILEEIEQKPVQKEEKEEVVQETTATQKTEVDY